MDRSSPYLSLYGGKTSIEEITRLHAPEKVSETMFTRSSATASFEAQNGGFPAPIQETGTTSELLGGRSTILRWKRLHRRLHVPPCAGEAPATFSTSQHVRSTHGHASGTRPCHVSPLCAAASVLIATSACHVSTPRQHATWQKKKKKKEEEKRGKFW
jgi:hypothetical protein